MENGKKPETTVKKVGILNLQYILIIRKKASADTRIERICVAAPKQ